MGKIEFKKKVLQKAKDRQQEIIDDFRGRIEEIRSSEMKVLDGQFDHGQQSMDESGHELISGLADQLNFVVDEMDFLNKLIIKDELLDKAEIGAVVITDQMTFYPSVSIENFEVDGEKIFGISKNALLFREMKGKKVGDTFSVNQKQYKIQDIF